MPKKYILKNDIVVFIAIIAISAAAYILYSLFFSSETNVNAEIYYDGKIAETINLSVSSDKIFSINEIPEIEFEIKNNAIRFKKSDCPDKICINTGLINKSGQTAVCLPNKISIRIVANSSKNDNEKIDTVI